LSLPLMSMLLGIRNDLMNNAIDRLIHADLLLPTDRGSVNNRQKVAWRAILHILDSKEEEEREEEKEKEKEKDKEKEEMKETEKEKEKEERGKEVSTHSFYSQVGDHEGSYDLLVSRVFSGHRERFTVGFASRPLFLLLSSMAGEVGSEKRREIMKKIGRDE